MEHVWPVLSLDVWLPIQQWSTMYALATYAVQGTILWELDVQHAQRLIVQIVQGMYVHHARRDITSMLVVVHRVLLLIV